MSKIDEYRQTLRELDDWIPFLLNESGLPGPRGNLELAYAVAEEGSKRQFEKLLSFQAKENTPEVFLVFCGIVGLGKFAVSETKLFDKLRGYASDERWRIREAVATGLQLAGSQDMELAVREMQKWSEGNWYERRAAAATLAEPRLLKEPRYVKQVLQILDKITASVETADHQKDVALKVLRQGMGYCWSVVVAALPEVGKPMFENWLNSQSKDVRWIVKENLRKNRLAKMDVNWVRACMARLEQTT